MYSLVNFFKKIDFDIMLTYLNTMSKPRSPVSLYSHLSVKLRQFGELLPSSFQLGSGDGLKEPFPALVLIKKLHNMLWHELLAPDYDENTKWQLNLIRTDLHRMVSATEEAVVICRAASVGMILDLHASTRYAEERLDSSAEVLISFIRKQLDPLIDAMISDAEKEAGQPMAICIAPYKPWDKRESVSEAFRELLKSLKETPVQAKLKCVPHVCGNPNKEPWPRCCREASVAISKQMEEHYFMEKRC
jgi:hypothetical protein